jgi:carboxylesterase type B
MTPADLAVTEALQASVLSMVTRGTPATGVLADWRPWGTDRPTALFDARTRVVDDPSAERRRALASVAAPV